MNGTPAVPPPSNHSARRVVVIIAGAFLVLGLLAVAGLAVAGYYLARHVHVTTETGPGGQEETIRVETPLGRLRVDKEENVDPELLDLPIYPGATVVPGKSPARVDLDLEFADKYLRVMAVEMETSDPLQKVVEYYRQEAPEFAFSRKRGGGVELALYREGVRKVIAIVQRGDKTRIALANVGEPEAN
jgi:hypothetical protein